jgi:hypothetical protein
MSNENNKPLVVLRWGQSNSGGVTGRSCFKAEDRMHDENVFIMSLGIRGFNNVPVPPAGQFYRYELPVQCKAMSNETGVSFIGNFVKKLANNNPGRPIYVIPVDVPGTGFLPNNIHFNWNRHLLVPSQNLTLRAVNLIKNYSPTGSFDYMVGIQGENDAQNSKYMSQATDFFNYMYDEFGPYELCLGTMLQSWINLGYVMNKPPKSDPTHRMLAHIPDLKPNATTSYHDDLTDAYDGVHFGDESQRIIGNRMYDAIHRNIHAYEDLRWLTLFKNNTPLFWYDFSRQNCNKGYLSSNAKHFWDRIEAKWNTKTDGVKIEARGALWTTNDHLDTRVISSNLAHYTKMVMFTPTTLQATQMGNLMSGSISSVLWTSQGTLQVLVAGHAYTIPQEQLNLKLNHRYLVVVSVSPNQVIFKVRDMTTVALSKHRISVCLPTGNNKHSFGGGDSPQFIGNIEKAANVSDGSDWYGFHGHIDFAAMLPRSLNDMDCNDAVDYFLTYWN